MGLIHALLLSLKGCCVYIFDDDAATYDAPSCRRLFCGTTRSAIRSTACQGSWTGGWGFDLIFCTRFGTTAIRTALTAAARGGRLGTFINLFLMRT